MKKICIYVILPIILGTVLGIYLYNIEKTKGNKVLLGTNTNSISNNASNTSNKEIATSFSEIRISPKTRIIEKTEYTVCGHIKEKELDNKNYINMTKEEFERVNPNVTIKTFNQDKVILIKEKNESCKEHYLLRDTEGYISIYSLDEKEEANVLIEKTEIATKYLSEQDKNELRQGIKVYSKTDLNKLIEDFES